MKKRPPVILLTGAPGSGKSTLVARLVEDLRAARIVGLSTPEVRRGRTRVGFEIRNLATGETELLASTTGEGPRVGKYHVDVAAIDRIVQRIEPSLASADFIFIDEIGKMELFSERFKVFVGRALSLDKPVVAAVHRGLAPQYRSAGLLVTVTRDNFEELRTTILEQLKAWKR